MGTWSFVELHLEQFMRKKKSQVKIWTEKLVEEGFNQGGKWGDHCLLAICWSTFCVYQPTVGQSLKSIAK